jgi:preprotein translocase subunit SecA
MYGKLSGMTGTAETEAPEFDKIYKLEVLVIPTNRPLIRVENPDVVYRTEPEKNDAVIGEIKQLHESGRPVLVGTISIEKSEELSVLLKKAGIKHVVLNAKYHEREAEIVAQAGRFGAVTIATNMAGRGTDIILGGVPDHRAKAIVAEKLAEAGQPQPDLAQLEREAAEQVAREMAGEFRRELQQRKLEADGRRELAKRYLGLMASFAHDHPSVSAVRALAPEGSALARYLEAARQLPRSTKEKNSKSFYPEIENPVDFLAVHPMKAALDEVAASPELQAVEALLEANERERVVALGGLHILGTERHEARRIDNQLRGRAGRQGDPGSSRFYLSLQDDLMRIFGSERISGLMLRLGMEEVVTIEHRMVTRSIERAQRQVEAQNFGVRKHLLEYDDVMNKQRKAIYDMRRMVLEGKDTREHVQRLVDEVVEWYADSYCGLRERVDTWSYESLQGALKETFGMEASLAELQALPRDEMVSRLADAIKKRYAERERAIGAERMLFHQRMLMLQIVDAQWKDHLYALDHLKEGIGLRGYGQRDPLVEYKKESYQMFQSLMDRIDEEILRWSFLYQPVVMPEESAGPEPHADQDAEPRATARPRPSPARPAAVKEPELAMAGIRTVPRNLTYNDPTSTPSAFAQKAQPREASGGTDDVQTVRREGPKVGRNDPCPCGSGKKYKKCHGS